MAATKQNQQTNPASPASGQQQSANGPVQTQATDADTTISAQDGEDFGSVDKDNRKASDKTHESSSNLDQDKEPAKASNYSKENDND